MSDRPTPETDDVAQLSSLLQYETVNANFARKLERERDELRQWKKEMLLIESQWDEQIVGRLLGLQLGDYIKPNIEPKLRQLIRERDEARSELSLKQQTLTIAEGTLSDLRKQRDEWSAMCGRYKQERDEAREERDQLKQLLATDSENVDAYLGVCIERAEARKELEEYRSIAENIGAKKAVSEKEQAIRERDEANSELNEKYIEHDQLFEEAEKIRIERDEAQAEIQRLRFDVQRDAEHHDRMIGELEKVYTERDDVMEKVKELIYIADRAIALANIDFENDKFGVVSELRNDLEKIKESK